jgi:hypothetical protein
MTNRQGAAARPFGITSGDGASPVLGITNHRTTPQKAKKNALQNLLFCPFTHYVAFQ